jgi:hypothetical protein
MSKISVDEIVDADGSGPPDFPNGVQIAGSTVGLLTQAEAENPASTVFGAVSGQRLEQQTNAAFNVTGSAPKYACRAWVNFDGTGTVAIRASGNVSSITDNGVGNYTVNFTTAMPDANYALVANGGDYSSGTAYLYTQERASTRTASSVRVATGFVNTGAAAVQDNAHNFVAIFR